MDWTILKNIRKKTGFSQDKFVRFLTSDDNPITQAAYSFYENGINVPSANFIKALITVLKVNPDYLFSGKEPMFLFQKDPTVAVPEGLEHLKTPYKTTGDEELYYVPFTNHKERLFPVMAGDLFPYDTENVRAFLIEDDSMVPCFYPDDVVLYLQGFSSRKDGIYIVQSLHGTCARKLEFESKETLRVYPLNKDYPSEDVIKLGYGFEILGLVIAKFSKEIG